MKHIREILTQAVPRKPRPVYVNAVQRAIEASRKLSTQDRENLQVICQEAFAGFKTAQRCPENWRCMADALNVAEALSEIGICSDDASRERIACGEAALSAVATRKRDGGSWTLRANEMAALDEALWMHAVQLEHCSLGEYGRATKRVADKTRAALAGNAGPGVSVVEVVR